MSSLAVACLAFSAAAFLFQTGTNALAAVRCSKGRVSHPPSERPGVSIVRPLCGVEPFSYDTLRSTFHVNYPQYEVLFCVAQAADPILPLVRSLIMSHPEREARVLIGEDVLGANPKLNNMAKGFHAARFDHIVFVDSNVLTPVHYLDQLVGTLESGAGMVTAPPVGQAAEGLWAELECAFLNSYQARMQYAVDALGFGFAQGKTLFFRRADLENGGLNYLASEAAEDAAATKMMRKKGRRIRLAGPFAQLVGRRRLEQVWKRQVRWARLRRASFPLFFAPEILAGLFPPLAAFLYGMGALDLLSSSAVIAFVLLWYLPELMLLRVAGWGRSILALLLRDLLLPLVFIAGCAGRDFEWHGHGLSASHRSAGRSPQFAAARDRCRRLRPGWFASRGS